MRLIRATFLTALLVLLLPAAVLATDQGASLKYGGGGLGTVIFDGRVHTGEGYVCKDCHDDLFMTKKQARVRMSDHFTDQLCFRCHNNQEASRDCITCHRSIPSSGMVSSDYMRAAMAHPVADAAERDQLLTGRSGVSEQTRACLSCHGDQTLEAKTEHGKTLNLHVDRPAYGVAAHGALPCASCHFGLAGEESFTTQPHALDPDNKVDCKSCHGERLAVQIQAFSESVHAQKTREGFSCGNCHNAHSQPKDGKAPPYMAAVRDMNQKCLACHTNQDKFKEFTDTPLDLKAMEHGFMEKFEAHKEAVLCADCHSPIVMGSLGSEPHKIMVKEQGLRDCSSCHTDMDSLIVARITQRDGNADALDDRYLPGNKAGGPLDRMGGWALMAILAAVVVHGLARVFGKKRSHEGQVVRDYVYPFPTRLFHWINAFCFLALLWTGAGIHFAGQPYLPGLERAAAVHTVAAYVLMANFAAFLIYGISSGDIARQYLPKGPGIVSRLVEQTRYYLYGMFTGADKPFPVSRERRFNPLQQLTYLVVFILGMPLLILSGVLLLLPENTTAGIAPRATLATAHFCLAIIYGLFLVVHLYLTTTGDSVFSLIRSMITGYHEHRKK